MQNNQLNGFCDICDLPPDLSTGDVPWWAVVALWLMLAASVLLVAAKMG